MTNGIYDTNSVKTIMGQRLREAREEIKLSRDKFSQLLNSFSDRPITNGKQEEMNVERLKQWEYGNNPIAVEWIPLLCRALNCDVGYLLGDYNERRRDIADVCKVTGLSAGAVENLKKYDERVVTYISFLLETGLINRTGLKASQCIDMRLEISHYERDVLPSLTIPPEDEKRAWREWKFSDSYLDMASKRTKVLDEIQRLKEVYDARLWRCCKDADKAVVDFIDKEVDKWLTSKNAATKTEN